MRVDDKHDEIEASPAHDKLYDWIEKKEKPVLTWDLIVEWSAEFGKLEDKNKTLQAGIDRLRRD